MNEFQFNNPEFSQNIIDSGIVTNGLVLNIDFGNPKSFYNGELIATDLTTYNNGGPVVGSPIYSTGSMSSLTFNGTSQYVSCSNSSSVQLTQGFVGAWCFSPNDTSGVYRCILSKQNNYGLYVLNNNIQSYTWGGGSAISTPATVGGTGKWYYAAMGWTNSVGSPDNNITFYLNAVNVQVATLTWLNDTVPVLIGFGNGASQYFTGSIANVSIYNRPLSQTEITRNFNANRRKFGL